MSLLKNNSKTELFGGVKARNVDEIAIKFFCELCKMVLISPWQLLCCGALLCRWCLKNGLSNSEPFTCQFCQTKQTKKQALQDRATERELKAIIIICYSCPWNGLYKDYLDHLQAQHSDLECTDCHERFFAINSFEEHRKELCIHRCMPCGLPDCMDSIKWYDMKSHYLSDKHQHILLIIISPYVNPKHRQSQASNRFEIIEKELVDINESIEMLLLALEILLSDFSHLKIEQIRIKSNCEQNLSKIDHLKKQDNENEKRIKELSDIEKSSQIELNNTKKATEENPFLILDNNGTTTLRFNYPNTSSFSLNSCQFKTSSYGYTFTLRVCSTTEYENEYLSIFLTLYNGEYNNLIPYPFLYDIHIALWDQSNQQKHIIDVLKPDLNSSSCARPTSEKNDEYGIMKFCLLACLTDTQSIYVKDGIFFIRVFVDFLNIGQNPFQMKNNMEMMSTST